MERLILRGGSLKVAHQRMSIDNIRKVDHIVDQIHLSTRTHHQVVVPTIMIGGRRGARIAQQIDFVMMMMMGVRVMISVMLDLDLFLLIIMMMMFMMMVMMIIGKLVGREIAGEVVVEGGTADAFQFIVDGDHLGRDLLGELIGCILIGLIVMMMMVMMILFVGRREGSRRSGGRVDRIGIIFKGDQGRSRGRGRNQSGGRGRSQGVVLYLLLL